MSPHDHNVALDRYPSTMEYQYYDGDHYYDAQSSSTNYDCSLYNSQSYYIPNMMLAVPDPQGEQQLIQTPIYEYSQSAFNSISVSPDLSCTASADSHDAGACSSIPTYYAERRPSYPPSWAQDVKNSFTHIATAQSSEYRATIARLSNDFLANASSLFGGSTSRTRNASTPLIGPTSRASPVQTGDYTPTRKRSLEVMNEQSFVDQVPAPFTRHNNFQDLTI
ncbi:hypothetical protein K503DRAFT_506493 [Rhizopogon vinicolor AM-OR11-026]|uniref:Uncharacterized protein n=1 Tax=Rhizopogon vinicolor AM-OR11-026 TaxID=1314800 RepID=A0A1B7N948_9AGAM|nr:hypothetical protein K503DRAFT_506493 [Rhizopogon vinicolor AM-OR11-026]